MTFAEALAQLQTGQTGVCRHLIGTASFIDEDDYDLLGRQFDEAVAALTATFGPPRRTGLRFLGQDLDQAACWPRAEGTTYVALTFADNTRVRMLTMGVARRGTVIQFVDE